MARKKRKHQPRGYRVLERSGNYTAQIRIAGFKSAGKTFATENEAHEWAEALVRDLRGQAKRGGARRDITQLTVGDLNQAFLDDPKTKQQKSFSDTQRLLDWWTSKYASAKVLEFGVLQIRDDARSRLIKGRGPSTVNRYLSVMRAAWNWGRDTGHIPSERAWPRRLMLPEPRGRTRFLSDEEIDNVLKAADGDPVMRAAILVSIATGLRQGELIRLKWSDIDFTGCKVTVQESKNDERRAVHLSSTAVDTLKGLRKLPVVSPVHVFVLKNGKPLKKSLLETRWRKIRKAAGLADFRWHDQRHSCASILLQNGATLAQVGSVLGHKSPGMTMRYAHLVAGAAVTGHDKLDAKLKPKQQ